jgi:hypothetical protein
VWDRGQADLIRLPDYAVMMICGDDLAEARPCPAAEAIFVNREISDRPMIYRLSTCRGPAGDTVALKEAETYLWLVNPFDPSCVFVKDTWGRYIGKCARIDQIQRAEISAIHQEQGRVRADFEKALAPLARRGAKAAAAMIADMSGNTALLGQSGGMLAARDTERLAIDAGRRAAVSGLSLDDLTAPDSAGETDTHTPQDVGDLL